MSAAYTSAYVGAAGWEMGARLAVWAAVPDKRVRQLQEPADLERPEAHRAARDRLVRIGIEEGEVVFDVERLHPARVTVSAGRPKTGGAQRLDVAVDALRLAEEFAVGLKQPAVVLEAVDANLEAVVP